LILNTVMRKFNLNTVNQVKPSRFFVFFQLRLRIECLKYVVLRMLSDVLNVDGSVQYYCKSL
jgi:hypothetical protein